MLTCCRSLPSEVDAAMWTVAILVGLFLTAHLPVADGRAICFREPAKGLAWVGLDASSL